MEGRRAAPLASPLTSAFSTHWPQRIIAAGLALLILGAGIVLVWQGLPAHAATKESNGAAWSVFNVTPSRPGVNLGELSVGPGNVSQLTVLWATHLPHVADSTPVYQTGRLYLTMKNGGAIAVDAASGAVLWQTLPPAGPMYTTSSPALDPSGLWVYSYGLDGFVHRYATTNGQQATGGGWPAPITLMPGSEKESSALNLANGKLLATTGGYPGDAPPYQGHVVAVDLASGSEHVFNTLCSNVTIVLANGRCPDNQSGVWARGGAVVDPVNGNVFIATGNGPWDGQKDWSDSVLELDGATLQLVDSYTPTNQQSLNSSDADLGSSAPALLPDQPSSGTPLLAVQVGKDGQIRLLNRQNLSGKGHPGNLGGELQQIAAPGTCEVLTAPTVWTDPSGSAWIFVANGCGLAAYKLVTSGGISALVSQWDAGTGGTSPIIADGVLYVARDGAVDARDPSSGQRLWTSTQVGASVGAIHWESPILVDGRLFIADESGTLTAFALPIPRPYKIFMPSVF